MAQLLTLCSWRPNPTVYTKYGKIEGLDQGYLAFKGIPYAKPPLAELRFQPPQEPDQWNDTKTCTSFGPHCPQIGDSDGEIIGDEDCLTLNVFTQELNPSQQKPVMVWFHGGAYERRASSEFGPDYLLEKEIVLVTVTFRLNIFGFLTVHDENAFGNVGLKDQVAALEWVQGNIAGFGGDPGRVTIFGESTGANSVALLHLSPRTQGLFQQMIIESGSALNARYLQTNPLKYVYNIARYFQISTETKKDIVEGLQRIDWKTLVKASKLTKATGWGSSLEAGPFFPVIEVDNPTAIITQSPYQLFETNNFRKIPFIIGYNTNEGSLGLKLISYKIDEFDINYELFYTKSLNNEDQKVTIGKIVRNHYLGNSSAKGNPNFNKFLGQELQVRAIRKTLDFMKQFGYLYRFSYKGTHTIEQEGVGHSEELQYLFPQAGKTENLTDSDVQTRKRMVEMWTNFVTFGSPTPESQIWQKCGDSINFLDIGEKLVPGQNPDLEEYEFWALIFQKFGQPPYLTY